ncbi:MAG: hypothetical protein H6672_21420 [Anaerolineaceae bacterium]|nr:hypothetical protein [Anaerolineaceae bacterium]
MLDQINNVDWESLGYPHMATWLLNLTSDDSSIRKEYFDRLYDSRVNTITKVSPYLIPFLLELLTEEKIQSKDELLNLLMQIASEAYYHPNDATAQLTLNKVEEGTHVYLAFLEDSENSSIAFELLGYLKGRLDQIASILLPMLNREEYKAVVAYTFYNLIRGGEVKNSQKYIDIFSILLSPNEDKYVRIAAAMGLSKLMGAQAPPEVDKILMEALTHVHIETRAYASSIYRLTQSSIELGVERAINILIEVISDEDKLISLFQILPTLLNLGFNGGVLVKYFKRLRKNNNILNEIIFTPLSETDTIQIPHPTLNPIQHRILQTLLDNNTVWELKTNIFQLHGLPSSKKELKILLSKI